MAKKTKEVKEKAIAKVGDPTTDITAYGVNDVPNMLEMVIKQINTLQGGMPAGPKTSASLTGFGIIEKIDTVESLIKAAATVIVKEQAYKDASEEILPVGIKIPEFKLNGVLAKNWLSDIKARVLIVANKEKLAKLNKIKSTLEANLSAEAKLAKDLKDIQGMLNDE